MKIIIAPDSFKGSLTAMAAAAAIEEGIKRVFPQARCIKIPMADGGEGTVDAILHAKGGKIKYKEVKGPARKKVRAKYGLLPGNKTAVVEMAEASGLERINRNRRNPLTATTYGTGELIVDALDRGVARIIIGIGGSATVDGGAGMAQALGIRFRDNHGRLIREVGCGGMLQRIASIDMQRVHPRLRKTKIIVATDVTNTLCGKKGAAHVYGPQKGATPEMVKILDKNLRHFAGIIRNDLNIDILNLKSAGAAGGLGGGLAAFTEASIKPGLDVVVKETSLTKKLKKTDLLITGEGCIDEQTLYGKVPVGVAAYAKKYDVPVIAMCGHIGKGAEKVYQHGIDSIGSIITFAISPDRAIKHASVYLANASEYVMRNILIGKLLKQ